MSPQWISAGQTLCHVTRTRNVAAIKRDGLRIGRRAQWRRQYGARYTGGGVYAFTSREDAVRWSARMDWDLYQETGSGKVSIVYVYSPKGEGWWIDDRDPLSQLGRKGEWLRRDQPVERASILSSEPVTRATVRAWMEGAR